jgi:hypothetical protein
VHLCGGLHLRRPKSGAPVPWLGLWPGPERLRKVGGNLGHWDVGLGLGFFAIVLAAISAALVGFRSYAELPLLAEQSHHMKDELKSGNGANRGLALGMSNGLAGPWRRDLFSGDSDATRPGRMGALVRDQGNRTLIGLDAFTWATDAEVLGPRDNFDEGEDICVLSGRR